MPKRKERRLPKPGVIFERTYVGKSYTLTVVTEGQGIGYRVGKTTYPSPSAAAKSITKTEVNGWKFWKIVT